MNYEQSYSNKSTYNKEEWVAMKNRERDATYRQIDLSAKLALKGGVVFQQYLDIQSKFMDYSVGNALLISLQMPETTIFKDRDNWEKVGVTVRNGEKGFKILEPSSPYVRPDGTKAQYYNPKQVYDISQTDGKPSDKAITYSDEELIKAFISNSPVPIKAVDKLRDNSQKAEYNKEENKLYVCKGLDVNIMLQSISSELAKISMGNKEENNLSKFECDCVSYMICKKYGVDVSNYKFETLPNEIKEMDVTEFRKELSNIRDTMLDVNTRIKENLEKKTKMKEYER